MALQHGPPERLRRPNAIVRDPLGLRSPLDRRETWALLLLGGYIKGGKVFDCPVFNVKEVGANAGVPRCDLPYGMNGHVTWFATVVLATDPGLSRTGTIRWRRRRRSGSAE